VNTDQHSRSNVVSPPTAEHSQSYVEENVSEHKQEKKVILKKASKIRLNV